MSELSQDYTEYISNHFILASGIDSAFRTDLGIDSEAIYK